MSDLDYRADRMSKAWEHAISLIYGEHVLDDLEFCTKHNKAIMRYDHGIMTLQGSSRDVLQGVASDPTSLPGWTPSIQAHPEDYAVLHEFFRRLIRHYERTRFIEHDDGR